MWPSPPVNELLDAHADVARNDTEQAWRDVPASVIRNGGCPTVGVSELLVRAALPDFEESEATENGNNNSRPKRRDSPHGSGYFEGLCADEGGIDGWFAILEEHINDLKEILPKLFERGALRVRSRPSGYITDEEAGVLIAFNDSSEGAHLELRKGL